MELRFETGASCATREAPLPPSFVKTLSRGFAPLAIVIALAALGLLLAAIFLPRSGHNLAPEEVSRLSGPVSASGAAGSKEPRQRMDSPSAVAASQTGPVEDLPSWAAAPGGGQLAVPAGPQGPQSSEEAEALGHREHSSVSRGEAGETVMVAEMDGDGSDYSLPSEEGGTEYGSSPAELRAAVLSSTTSEEAKLDLLATLVPQFSTDEEAVNFLTSVASDPRQPEQVRADAVTKLADYGVQYVEAFASSDSLEVAEEVDLIQRLEEFRRQEGLPPGAVRAGGP